MVAEHNVSEQIDQRREILHKAMRVAGYSYDKSNSETDSNGTQCFIHNEYGNLEIFESDSHALWWIMSAIDTELDARDDTAPYGLTDPMFEQWGDGFLRRVSQKIHDTVDAEQVEDCGKHTAEASVVKKSQKAKERSDER